MSGAALRHSCGRALPRHTQQRPLTRLPPRAPQGDENALAPTIGHVVNSDDESDGSDDDQEGLEPNAAAGPGFLVSGPRKPLQIGDAIASRIVRSRPVVQALPGSGGVKGRLWRQSAGCC